MNTLHHVLLPCKMTSRRIPRKNLATVGGRRLLELQIDRFRSWFPQASIWVATEDAEAASLATSRGCRVVPLSEDYQTDRRSVDDLFAEWLQDRLPADRCCYHQVTSPFTFRSELLRGIVDERPYCRSAWLGVIHPAIVPADDFPLSQQLPKTTILTGNFGVAWGRYQFSTREAAASVVPVSRLSAIDIDEPDDLSLADFIARRLTLYDFDDLKFGDLKGPA